MTADVLRDELNKMHDNGADLSTVAVEMCYARLEHEENVDPTWDTENEDPTVEQLALHVKQQKDLAKKRMDSITSIPVLSIGYKPNKLILSTYWF